MFRPCFAHLCTDFELDRNIQLVINQMQLPGVTSLVTKSAFLLIAVILAGFGIHKERPFLFHCIHEPPPLANSTDVVIFCDFDETDNKRQNCVPTETDRDRTEKVINLLEALKKLEDARNKVIDEMEGWDMGKYEHQLPDLGNVTKLREEVEEEVHELGIDRLVQKVRICGKNEKEFRIVVLVILLLLITLAAFATFHLHKITSYKVGTKI